MITAATVDAIKAALDDELRSRSEWDEDPALFTLHRQPDGHVHMIQLRLSAPIWHSDPHPPTVVSRLAAALAVMPRNADGRHAAVPGDGELIGAAFRCEVYAVAADSPHPAAREAAQRRTAGGSVPRFKDIPGRIEQRCINAADLDGGLYMSTSSRLDETRADAAEPRTLYVASGAPDAERVSGNVVDALNRFLQAIKPAPSKGVR